MKIKTLLSRRREQSKINFIKKKIKKKNLLSLSYETTMSKAWVLTRLQGRSLLFCSFTCSFTYTGLLQMFSFM